MAVLNEIIWRTQSTDFWVSFKAFGVIPITAVFAMLQTSLIKRHSIAPATDEATATSSAVILRRVSQNERRTGMSAGALR